MEVWEIPKGFTPSTFITILIPVRNESAHIETCLQSILSNSYPIHLLQIIVIDDHSTDDTATLALQYRNSGVEVLYLKDYFDGLGIATLAYKKSAIEYGISKAKGELMVATDGDCRVSRDWLGLLASYYERYEPVFIAAPVCLEHTGSSFQRFQALDFVGMMGVTGAGIEGGYNYMCNGANLAYRKDVFYAVGGFEGINAQASGDDMLLMQKIATMYPSRIGFLKNVGASTFTAVKPSMGAFFSQRLRWASKSTKYQKRITTVQLALVLFLCCTIVLNVALSVLDIRFLWLFVFQVLAKSIVDYCFLGRMALFFKRSDLMRGYWLSQVYHVCYIVLVGGLSNVLKKYYWKGRKVS